MKKVLYSLAISVSLLAMITPAMAQSTKVPEGIVRSFKAGNAAELSKFFQSNVELIILNKEDVYSNTQAEQIIRKFFVEHKPDAFRIIFEGGKESSRYAIGSLDCTQNKYRVYILMKTQDGSSYIHQLRIEEEEANDQ